MNDATMTVKELSDLLEIHPDAIKRKIRVLFPVKMENGKETRLNYDEINELKKELKVTAEKLPMQNEQVPMQNEQLLTTFTNVMNNLNNTLQIINTRLEKLENKQEVKQLEYIQDYYSIIGYANFIKIPITMSNALILGKQASKLSKEKNKDIRKIPDERWGFVNSYHIDILKEVFEF